MQVGRLLEEQAATAVSKEIASAFKKLRSNIAADHSVSVLDPAKIVYHFARTVVDAASPVSPLYMVTALWRQSDGKPASRVMSGSSGAAVDIPTPAQLGIALLAQKRAAAWVNLLEQRGQCISQSALARQSASLFAPSRSADVMSGGVAMPSVTVPAQYRFWTADGGQVIIDWKPQTDPKAKTRTTINVSFTPGNGFQMANVAGLPTESQDAFGFGQVWAQADKDSVPVVDLGKPPDYDGISNVVPSGQGTMHGTAIVTASTDGHRVVSVTGNVAGDINGTVYLNLTGDALGAADVSQSAALPMTMSFISGGCAFYSGSVTKTSTGLAGVLSGPAGLVTATVQYTPDQRIDQFYGIVTLTPQQVRLN